MVIYGDNYHIYGGEIYGDIPLKFWNSSTIWIDQLASYQFGTLTFGSMAVLEMCTSVKGETPTKSVAVLTVLPGLVNIHFAMENGHRNSGLSHEKWWIFPWQNVSSPEGNQGFPTAKNPSHGCSRKLPAISNHKDVAGTWSPRRVPERWS